MKFGIFIFGDNHPELGRSNQRYYEEVLTIAEWAEELGFDDAPAPDDAPAAGAQRQPHLQPRKGGPIGHPPLPRHQVQRTRERFRQGTRRGKLVRSGRHKCH